MIVVNQELCIGCGLCVKDCVDGRMSVKNNVAAGPETCLECGHCVAICPKNAVTMEGYDQAGIETIESGSVLNPQSLLKSIKSRRSIRQYTGQRIGEPELKQIVEAARYTATAKNIQGSTYVFVQDQIEELKNLVWKHIEEKTSVGYKELDTGWLILSMFLRRKKKNAEDDFLFRNAPSVMIISNDRMWDAAMEAQNMENMAVSLGMGVLFNGFLTEVLNQNPEIKSWLGIPEKNIATVMLMGYPSVKYQRTVPRKAADLIIK